MSARARSGRGRAAARAVAVVALAVAAVVAVGALLRSRTRAGDRRVAAAELARLGRCLLGPTPLGPGETPAARLRAIWLGASTGREDPAAVRRAWLHRCAQVSDAVRSTLT